MPVKNYFYKKALKEGQEKSKSEDVVNLFKKGGFSPERISELLEIPLEKVRQYLKDGGLLR